MKDKNYTIYKSFVEKKFFLEEALESASNLAVKERKSLSQVLLEKKLVSEEDLNEFVSQQIDIPKFELTKSQVDVKLASLIPEILARKHSVVPLFVVDNIVTIAVYDPLNVQAIEEIEIYTGLTLNVILVSKDTINMLIEYCYSKNIDKEYTEIDQMFEMSLSIVKKKSNDEDIEDLVAEAPIAKLVDMILKQAIMDNSSDIHIEPEETELRIRYRVDGILREAMRPPKPLETAIISRIKIMSGLDITERRKPQDGRLTIAVNDRTVDFRVSTVRTAWGEKVVLRILDKKSILVSLEKIGFSQHVYDVFMKAIAKPSGILLVTGPTGSGKTTTLYAALNKLNTPDKNIVTVEDPVEYNLASINQIPVNAKIGVTFATGLRCILRQDPDIIMIGEIRDLETATIAIQASQTGHFVFSTLHTNNAPGAMTRLVDMGMKPFLIASSVLGVLAQRLVRVICPSCKKLVTLTSADQVKYKDILAELTALYGEVKIYEGKGCKYCGGRGYKGRLGIFEYLEIDEELQSLIVNNATVDELRKLARKKGMRTMKEDGLEKIHKGITTMEEVLRVMSE
ncbi:MAG: type II secretion system protein GspE [Candidatus Margulisiibacteriota bacterium]|nr:MAG: hypothetical protein A2X43_03710 [Candidatus Margulisbacteria bacterium GWD2_39_127]OGI02480.1 MAG: hypothetical protein A2X42_07335 [Candidatus Margulisbacteria bacterium GWF2_38_17]OGI10973.1 MAG: hypothetical protein A2X41_01860 [Candidatus Margulisbacteria bacterium GWE2_39_32]PZM83168.1 MAG: type II secretion system protein GspE [Candidatus Margulisiibacteriota bacterium]HAR62530.1 type II secretion system protein GspE [Candidatus Margulisiibacteriota bacterium]